MNPSQYSYDKYNYWNIPLNELPTRGMFYPKDTKIKMRSMSVLDVKFLATYRPELATEVCNELLFKCSYLENIKLEDLYLPDRIYLIFWIRNNSFTNGSSYVFDIKSCQHCTKPYKAEVRLSDFKIKYLDDMYANTVYLSDFNVTMPLTIPKFSDSLYKPKNEFEEMALWLDLNIDYKEKCKIVENMSGLDYASLYNTVTNNFCGFEDEFQIYCPHCGGATPVKVSLTDDNLFTHFPLPNILERIARICKYAHLQITNDWAWPEVEIMEQIINKIYKEEEAEYNKNNNTMTNSGIPSNGPLPQNFLSH